MEQNSQNLFTLVHKLENLVNRFETALTGSVTPTFADGPAQDNSAAQQKAAPVQAAAPVKQVSAAPAQPKVPQIVTDLEKEVLSKIKPLEDAAKDLGNDVVNQITAKFISTLLSQKDVILTRLACKAPADKALLLKHI
jgi:hypothetical protein